ncbi:MAG TPA: carboxypeptidase-like regulatory domain-containing protein, partial [Chitinophagaceae bacterium]
MRKIASLLAVLMLFSALAFSQTRIITGRVTDEKGDALPGATIRLKGTNTGVTAGENGQFSISAKTGDVLVVSGAGLEPTEIKVGAGSTISVEMKRVVVAGSEVVVTSLGIARPKKELGYATTKVSSAELTKGRAVNIANGLQGKVSG